MEPDPDTEGQVLLDLVPDREWQWLVDQVSPVRWNCSQTRRVRRISELGLQELRDLRPASIKTKGWDLAVDPEGGTVTVRAAGPIVVTALNNGVLQLHLADQRADRGADMQSRDFDSDAG